MKPRNVPGTIVTESEPESSIMFQHNATEALQQTTPQQNKPDQMQPKNQTNNNNSPTEASATPYEPENNLFNRYYLCTKEGLG